MNWKLFSRRPKRKDHWSIRTMFGPNLNFAVSEAYKLLRTNIMFLFAEEEQGHIIGITSAVQTEGKSSTACNTAYALAEAGCRVLLLEGDLRRPTLGTKLGLSQEPGITNALLSKTDYHELIQHCEEAPKVDVLTSGDVPPNPSELLTTNRMEQLLEQFKADYDYIVMDLPPITAVSDALAVSKFLDGVVMVVRGGISDQKMLAEAMRQLRQVEVRILGFVYRDDSTIGSSYRYSYRYRKKYNKYNSDYAQK